MAITIGSSRYTYLRDAINAANNNDTLSIEAGTYNVLDYSAGLPQNINNNYCGSYAPSLSRFFSSQSGITGLTLVGAVAPGTGTPLVTITNLSRLYAGAKDSGYGIPTNWTIQNLNLQFNFTAGSEYILQAGNYGSLTSNLAGLTLRNVVFQGTHVGSGAANGGAYTDLNQANSLLFDAIKVGSDFGGQNTYVAGTTSTVSSGGSAFLFAQGSDMKVQNSTFVETRYGNSITFWGSTNALLFGNVFDGDGQLKQRGQILSNSSGTVNSNVFVGGTHLDLIDMGSKTLSAVNNEFRSTSVNSPTATVNKGVGIIIASTNGQDLAQASGISISGNLFTDVNPIVVQLSGSSTGSAGSSPQLSFGSNQVFNPVTSAFTSFGRFIIGGTSNDILTGALTTSKDDFISGAQGNDTLIGNGGNDAFVFAFQPGTVNNNVDTINDFKAASKGADKIWLDDAVFTTLSKGSLGLAFGTKINYDATSKGLYYDPTGSGSVTETGSTLKIAILNGSSTAPLGTDFVVF